MNKKIFLKFIFSIILNVLIVIPVIADEVESQSLTIEHANAQVVKVLSEIQDDELSSTFGEKQKIQIVKLKILSGKHEGKEVTVENRLSNNPAYDIPLDKGNRVVVDIETEGDYIDFFVSDRDRTPVLLITVGLFLLSLLLIGGYKGLNSIISMVITTGLVFFLLIPQIINGQPILPSTILISVLATLSTMLLVGGVNYKSISATLGTIASLTICGLLAIFVINLSPLTGFSSQESIMLYNSNPELNFTGILTSAIMIAALGAVMDVGISVASCIAEIKKINNDASLKTLIKSGLNVGKDMIGTMSNTLILAYIGSSFPLVILAINTPLIKLLNLNSIATEISSALIGSIGIVLCVPITAVIAAYLLHKDFKVCILKNIKKY